MTKGSHGWLNCRSACNWDLYVKDGVAGVMRGIEKSAAQKNVFNLGHGISRLTPPENVAALVDAVHDQSRIFH